MADGVNRTSSSNIFMSAFKAAGNFFGHIINCVAEKFHFHIGRNPASDGFSQDMLASGQDQNSPLDERDVSVSSEPPAKTMVADQQKNDVPSGNSETSEVTNNINKNSEDYLSRYGSIGSELFRSARPIRYQGSEESVNIFKSNRPKGSNVLSKMFSQSAKNIKIGKRAKVDVQDKANAKFGKLQKKYPSAGKNSLERAKGLLSNAKNVNDLDKAYKKGKKILLKSHNEDAFDVSKKACLLKFGINEANLPARMEQEIQNKFSQVQSSKEPVNSENLLAELESIVGNLKNQGYELKEVNAKSTANIKSVGEPENGFENEAVEEFPEDVYFEESHVLSNPEELNLRNDEVNPEPPKEDVSKASCWEYSGTEFFKEVPSDQKDFFCFNLFTSVSDNGGRELDKNLADAHLRITSDGSGIGGTDVNFAGESVHKLDASNIKFGPKVNDEGVLDYNSIVARFVYPDDEGKPDNEQRMVEFSIDIDRIKHACEKARISMPDQLNFKELK